MSVADKPLVIPVFIPHSGCPHQCAFCNQAIITSAEPELPSEESVREIISSYLKYRGGRRYVELAFFGGNFLGLPRHDILALLDMVQPYMDTGQIDGIRFSTRPDTISESLLELVRSHGVLTIELGVQSMNNKVLAASKRGHTAEDTVHAMSLLKEYRFNTGVQVMAGLPEDTEASLLESTEKLAGLRPDFARIYPLMVLRGSLVEHWYRQGRYVPLELDQAVDMVASMFLIFKKADVKVIRMGLQASETLEDRSMMIKGPWHPCFGHLVFSRIMFDRVCRRLDAMHLTGDNPRTGIILRVNPASDSRLRGNRNSNLKKLEHCYPELCFKICHDGRLEPDEIAIDRM
jgi:histone acetyltransferase (RNA polymerase elongator complex component)